VQIEEAFVLQFNEVVQEKIDVKHFKQHINDYTIIDVRNEPEVEEKKILKKVSLFLWLSYEKAFLKYLLTSPLLFIVQVVLEVLQQLTSSI
jgi:hypothetical protein